MVKPIVLEEQQLDNVQEDQKSQKIKSKILSNLFKEVTKENTSTNTDIGPKQQYVRGAHTQGVYHKQYNRYS